MSTENSRELAELVQSLRKDVKCMESVMGHWEDVTQDREFFKEPLISKEMKMNMTGTQIQSELLKKYEKSKQIVDELKKDREERRRRMESIQQILNMRGQIEGENYALINNIKLMMNKVVNEMKEMYVQNADELMQQPSCSKYIDPKEEGDRYQMKRNELEKFAKKLMEKRNWEVDIQVMLSVGKYFKSTDDYINIMKVCKKYRQLTSMYHYNPISYPYLFKGIETQHFYFEEDRKMYKLSNMFSYVYWYEVDEMTRRNRKPNEVFMYVLENDCIKNNMYMFEKWSGLVFRNKVLFDSFYDSRSEFVQKIKGAMNVYYIVIDNNDNIFGHYMNNAISDKGINVVDNGLFLFSLRTNDILEPKVYTSKDKMCMAVCNEEDNELYYVKLLPNDTQAPGNGYNPVHTDLDFYYGMDVEERNSHICNLNKCFTDLGKNGLIGLNYIGTTVEFQVQRILVIQME